MKYSALILGLSASLLAEEAKPTLFDQIIQPKVSFQSDFLSEANFEGFDASVQTYKQQLKVNNELLGISYSRWDFDWDNENDLPFYRGKTPIESMESIRLFANLPLPINDQWFMLNSVNVNATYEEEYSDSFGAGILSFFSYRVDTEHAVQIGVLANYHPVKTLVLPVMGYTYRIRETDGLQLLLGFPRAYVGYHLNPRLLLNAGMVFSQAVIRLADQSGIEPKGFTEAKDYQSNVGIRYQINDDFELTADLLYAFKRDFTIYNHQADEIDAYSIEPSAGAIVKLQYLF
ncbi:MAG TPA: hypothetical protein PLH07_09800 [Sulfurovum sp.]|jgi:hypothetical protein|nr:MAG: hypothetical protein B7Y63_04495 [Sulfurovum sp. 35-42-20]OYY57240.1 MAG: hypothetical protein B7Y52_01780 [Sulfurovum sp. 28-43-6]OYZ24741.1 MAG: hypothetical protein B7Y23_08515 [Sulfurovum sp. 16-42-52]OYZ49269.1 MAG: hypothetical protein B7Y13_05115 [Sulfurovum sp. 24-42-9]OZA44733.1 MAG: hypothetical protein B7X80_07155 [Sulfurovum sp. 17-42-90]OZA59286.1 MAG: hypothetical protein B7X69_08710 [Sulfurovum sp. 39-42-12]HQR74127.1 hypothetical protein [Sulfurovum sp.]